MTILNVTPIYFSLYSEQFIYLNYVSKMHPEKTWITEPIHNHNSVDLFLISVKIVAEAIAVRKEGTVILGEMKMRIKMDLQQRESLALYSRRRQIPI